MTLSIKDMIEYGYEWVGMIPVTEEEIRTGKVSDKTFYVLYPDNTEAALNNEERKLIFDPKIDKDSIFGFERSEIEIKLINKAIEALRYIKKNIERPYERVNYIMTGEKMVWESILHMIGFTDEDIDIAVERADLGFNG